MLPMTGGTVLKRDKEVSWIQETTECMAKVAQGMSVGMEVAQVVGFNKVHVKVLVDARSVEFSKVHAKVFNKDVKDFKVAQAVEFSKVQCLGTACSAQGCGQGMPCVSGQGQKSQGPGQVLGRPF